MFEINWIESTKMFYDFPVITHIDQVRAAVKGRPEFFEKDCGDYIIFNYQYNSPETFPPVASESEAILRECRGLTFDRQGHVIARKFHKFFNIGEKEEVFPENVDWSQPFTVLEKLDGSMIVPVILIRGDSLDLEFHTKMGKTEVADKASHLNNVRYQKFVWQVTMMGLTPIFEYTSPSNQIVIKYPKSELTLLAIRNNITGKYIPYSSLLEYAEFYNIPLVQQYQVENINEFMELVRGFKDREGVVIRFDSGHMFKIKADEYVTIHRAKDNLTHEKNLVKLIATGAVDDLKPMLPPDDRERLVDFEFEIFSGLNRTVREVQSTLADLHHVRMERRTYGLAHAKKDPLSHFVFKFWDDYFDRNKIFDYIMEYVSKSCSTQTKIDATRWIWGGAVWNSEDLNG